MAIKTTWTEVNQIIKEEFQRVMEKKKIQSRIQQINEELAHMEEEDSTMMGDENLEEVEAGSEMKVRSHAWTGKEDGDTKWTPEFEHKGSHLLEDEELEVEEDEEDDSEGSLADEFAELGAAIEAKIMAALGKIDHEASETPEEEEDFEEVKFSDEDEEEEGNEDEEDVVVSDEDEEEEGAIDEYNEVVPSNEDGGVTTTHSMDDEKKSLNESTTKRNGKYLNVLSEGLDSRKKNALSNEIERMRKLARLGNND
jgi:uncharacterized protein with von Willebrand factor type A (vWA) domain